MALTNLTTEISHTELTTTDSIPVTFPFIDESHLVVTVDPSSGNTTTLTITTDYTVAGGGALGTGGYDTGTVTLVNSGAHAASNTIAIQRLTPLTQGTDFTMHSIPSSNAIENALDRMTMIAQEQQRDLA